jgi:uncharacterized protein (TIGR02996 family)
MTHDEAFLQAILDSPDDDAPRLIYADWLEEKDDPRAAVVRRHPALFRFLADLKTVRDPDAALRQLAEWTFGGKPYLVGGLALLLSSSPVPGVAEIVLD